MGLFSWLKKDAKPDESPKPSRSSAAFEDKMPGWKPDLRDEEAEAATAGRPLEISCEEVAKTMAESKNKRLHFLDVREDWEHARRRIAGSAHIPLGAVQGRLDDIAEMAQHSDLLVVYCEHGMRSLDAAEFMRREGIDQARSMSGGMSEWAATIGERIESGPPESKE